MSQLLSYFDKIIQKSLITNFLLTAIKQKTFGKVFYGKITYFDKI